MIDVDPNQEAVDITPSMALIAARNQLGLAHYERGIISDEAVECFTVAAAVVHDVGARYLETMSEASGLPLIGVEAQREIAFSTLVEYGSRSVDHSNTHEQYYEHTLKFLKDLSQLFEDEGY